MRIVDSNFELTFAVPSIDGLNLSSYQKQETFESVMDFIVVDREASNCNSF